MDWYRFWLSQTLRHLFDATCIKISGSVVVYFCLENKCFAWILLPGSQWNFQCPEVVVFFCYYHWRLFGSCRSWIFSLGSFWSARSALACPLSSIRPWCESLATRWLGWSLQLIMFLPRLPRRRSQGLNLTPKQWRPTDFFEEKL